MTEQEHIIELYRLVATLAERIDRLERPSLPRRILRAIWEIITIPVNEGFYA